MIDARAKLPIKLDVEEPFTVGADRIANTLAASRIHKRDAIVVDLGTATTYDCITADGSFLGGVIQPGIMISADTLFRRTAQLPATDIVPAKEGDRPPHRRVHPGGGAVTARSTRSTGSSGGSRRSGRARRPPIVIATGGMAEAIKPHSAELELVDPFLTLKGIRLGYDFLKR